MPTILRACAALLLAFNAVGAFYGSIQMLRDPSGALLQMPLSFLERSPFQDYFIPGIILFVVNGVCSTVALVALWRKHILANRLVMAQGVLLGGWILVQMLLLQMFYPPLHGTFLLIALLLIVAGFILERQRLIQNL